MTYVSGLCGKRKRDAPAVPTHRGLLCGRALPKRLHGTETAVNPSALQHEIGSDYRGPRLSGS